nr:hypothetical protein [Tanacetum cinerariifolium]
MVDVNVNAPASQAPTMAPLVRSDDQIFPHIRWVPIGKSNCYLDVENRKAIQSTRLRCQLDEQWFDLTKDTLRDALQITHVNDNQAFTSPSSSDALINFVNELGYLKLDEFTQSIHTFIKDKRNLAQRAHGKKKATLIVILNIQEASYYQEYLAKVAKHQRYLASETGSDPDSPALKPTKTARKPKPMRALEESMKSMYDVPRGPLSPVVIKETESGKYQPLSEVPEKGKEKVIEEQVAHDLLNLQTPKKKSPADRYIFQRRTSTPTGSSGHDESSCLYAELGLTDNEEASKEDVPGADAGGQGEGQAGPDPGAQAEGQAGPDPGAQDEGQAGSNPNKQLKGQAGSDPDLIQENKRLDSHGARMYTLEQLDILHQVSKAVDEVVTDAVDWAIQAPLRNRFRDLPEADMKEILHQHMWETDSYNSHKDHMQLYKALEKSMNRDHSEELAKDLAEARKKKKKSRESPKTPLGSPPHQPPPPPPPAGPSGASRSPRASGSSQVPPPPPPPPSTNQKSQSKGSAAPSSSMTAASAEYQAWTTTEIRLGPSISLTPADLQMDEDMDPDEQAHSSDDEDIRNSYIPKKIVLRCTDLNEHVIAERDFKYLYPSDFEDLYLLNLQGHLNYLPLKDKKILTTAVNLWTRHLVIRHRVEDFQLGIESYQTQLNLTKPRWDATGFEYKHDYTVIDSPRAVTFQDRYGVKEFKINRMNPCLNTRLWTRKDVDRSKEFIFAIQKRLKTRRIFRNLESSVGKRVKDGDYRLLKRTE